MKSHHHLSSIGREGRGEKKTADKDGSPATVLHTLRLTSMAIACTFLFPLHKHVAWYKIKYTTSNVYYMLRAWLVM